MGQGHIWHFSYCLWAGNILPSSKVNDKSKSWAHDYSLLRVPGGASDWLGHPLLQFLVYPVRRNGKDIIILDFANKLCANNKKSFLPSVAKS